LINYYKDNPKTIGGEAIKGKTLEEMYGAERAEEIREKIQTNQVAWLKGQTKETSIFIQEQAERQSIKLQAYYQTEEGRKTIEKVKLTKKIREENGLIIGRRILTEIRICACGCNQPFVCKVSSSKKFVDVYHAAFVRKGQKKEILPRISKFCECGCGSTMRIKEESNQRFASMSHYRTWVRQTGFSNNKSRTIFENELVTKKVMNHKVVCVRRLVEREDTYNLEVENNHNFATEAGIFIKNSNPLGVVEDLFIPVWGDDLNSVRVEKLGGEVDIKWIVDIEELRNQLATALRCPLSLLGGYIKEATGPLGSEAFENLDIRFARSSRRLQRALIEGVTRLCQIHLAYQGMDPDPALFQVHMSETSTAEEMQIRDALDKSIDAIDKFLNMTKNLGVEFDQLELLNYFNTKILKLGDMDLKKFVKGVVKEAPIPLESRQAVISEAMRMIRAEDAAKVMRRPIQNLDYLAHLPMLENTSHKTFARGGEWTEQYKDTKIEIREKA
jgi:hypothetical protein